MKITRGYYTHLCFAFLAIAPSMLGADNPDEGDIAKTLEATKTQLQESRKQLAGLEEALAKIEAAVAQQPSAETTSFNWSVQNELRHFYGARDPEKSFNHCNVILRNSVMDDYILKILSGWATEPEAQLKNLRESSEKYPKFTFVFVACTLRAAELTSDSAMRRKLLHRVIELDGEGMAPYMAIARTILRATSSE